ncbi:hypothetical protein IDH28_02820 [Pelagibacterales bacterium SAG-MED31]|nr:hypothetical protein [Pelagibacterales bacterium SAG-MED31]
MKILFTLFILLFSSSVLAEDISDFEIEGMSIGDSLLDYVSKKEILENKRNYFPDLDNTFSMSAFENFLSSNLYDWIQIGYFTNDRKFIIQIIDGVISYIDNIDECYSEQDNIKNELSRSFDLNAADWDFYETDDPNTGDNFTTYLIVLKSGIEIVLSCQDWGDEENRYFDHLKINIATKQFNDWVYSR